MLHDAQCYVRCEKAGTERDTVGAELELGNKVTAFPVSRSRSTARVPSATPTLGCVRS